MEAQGTKMIVKKCTAQEIDWECPNCGAKRTMLNRMGLSAQFMQKHNIARLCTCSSKIMEL